MEQTGTLILQGMEQGGVEVFWFIAGTVALTPLAVGLTLAVLLWKRTPRNDLWEQEMRDLADANVRQIKLVWTDEQKEAA